jgi:hypothetical protein
MAALLSEPSQAPCPSGGSSPGCRDLADPADSESNEDIHDTPHAAIHEDKPNKDTTSTCGSQGQENRPHPLCDIDCLPYTLTLSLPGRKLDWTGILSLCPIGGEYGQGTLCINPSIQMGIIQLGWNMTFIEGQSTPMPSQDTSRGRKSPGRPEKLRKRRLRNPSPGCKSTGK